MPLPIPSIHNAATATFFLERVIHNLPFSRSTTQLHGQQLSHDYSKHVALPSGPRGSVRPACLADDAERLNSAYPLRSEVRVGETTRPEGAWSGATLPDDIFASCPGDSLDAWEGIIPDEVLKESEDKSPAWSLENLADFRKNMERAKRGGTLQPKYTESGHQRLTLGTDLFYPSHQSDWVSGVMSGEMMAAWVAKVCMSPLQQGDPTFDGERVALEAFQALDKDPSRWPEHLTVTECSREGSTIQRIDGDYPSIRLQCSPRPSKEEFERFKSYACSHTRDMAPSI